MQKLLLVDNESKVNFKCIKNIKIELHKCSYYKILKKESGERSRLFEEGISIKRKFKNEFIDYPNNEVCLS